MRILIVTHMLYPERIGGREKYVVRLAEQWSKEHKVGIVFYSKRNEWSILSQKGIKLHRVRWLPKFFPLSQIMLVYKTVVMSLINNYDLIYVNSLATPELAGLSCKLLFRKKLAGAIHSPIELVDDRIQLLSRWIKKIFLMHSCLIIVVSKDIALLLSKFTGISLNKISYVPGGVEDDFFELQLSSVVENAQTSESDKGYASKLIITSRRLVPDKGIDVLIRAIKILVDSGLNVKCIIAGEGPERNNLETLSKQLELGSNVSLAGRLSDEDLKKLISKADCCVLSSYFEGTPLSLLEYMASGKPVVTTNVGGMVDILPTKDLIVATGNPSALAKKIAKVILNEEYAKEVGIANRQAAKKYTWRIIASKIIDLFAEACKIGKVQN